MMNPRGLAGDRRRRGRLRQERITLCEFSFLPPCCVQLQSYSDWVASAITRQCRTQAMVTCVLTDGSLQAIQSTQSREICSRPSPAWQNKDTTLLSTTPGPSCRSMAGCKNVPAVTASLAEWFRRPPLERRIRGSNPVCLSRTLNTCPAGLLLLLFLL